MSAVPKAVKGKGLAAADRAVSAQLVQQAETTLYRLCAFLRGAELLIEHGDVSDDEPGQHTLRLILRAQVDAKRVLEILDDPQLVATTLNLAHDSRFAECFDVLFDLEAHTFAAATVYGRTCVWEKSDDGGAVFRLLEDAFAAAREASRCANDAEAALPGCAEAA